MLKADCFFEKIFLIFLIIIFGIKCLYLLELLPTIIGIIGVLMIVGTFVFVWFNLNKWEKIVSCILDKVNRISLFKLSIILISVSFLLKIFAILIFRIDSITSHADIAVYIETAYELATKGFAEKYAGYCFSNPHLFWFAALLSPVAKVFGDAPLAMSIYMTIISTLSVYFLFDTVAYCFSKSKAFITLLVFSIMPSQILLTQYITHEHALLFFVSLSAWLYFRVLPLMTTTLKKVIVFALFVLSVISAKQVNGATIIILIIYCIIFVVQSYRENKSKACVRGLIKCLIVVTAIFVGSSFCTVIQKNHSMLSPDYYPADKYTWVLFVGSNVQEKGMWNQEDVDYFDNIAEGLEQEDAYKIQRQALKERYKLLLENPLDIAKLIQAKLSSQWSAFTYPIMFSNETITNKELQQFYNKYLDRLLVLIEYGFSLLAVFRGLILNFSKGKIASPDLVLFFELYLMGVTALFLLTECTNKYTLSMQPIFWLACFCDYKSTNKRGT